MNRGEGIRGFDAEVARRSLALGALLYGYVSLSEAADMAGLPASALEMDVQRLRVDDAAISSPGGQAEGRRPTVSVVMPVFNEEMNVEPIAARLAEVLASLPGYELIFVDDGSSDASFARLKALHATDCRVKIVQLSRNFGHQNALSAGLDRASGDAVVIMDADGQDPPELVPTFIEHWRSGHEVVFGVRRHRKEPWWKRASYGVFYRLLARIGELEIPLDAGDFCLMDRRVVDVLRELSESGQFLRGLRSWVGFRQIGVAYDRPARERGETAYSFNKLVRLALDGILSFSSVPLRIASWLGFLVSVGGLLYLGVGIAWRVAIGHVPAGWTSLLGVIVILGGAQLSVIGVLGEYLARVYSEAKRRPRYVVRDTYW